MVDENILGPWGQIVLVAVGAICLIAALLVIACFLTPGCLGYECIRIRKKEGNSLPLKYIHRAPKESLQLNDISYRSWRLGSLYENTNNGAISETSEYQSGPKNSLSSQIEAITTSSTLNLIQAEKRKIENKLKNFPTELTLSLRYIQPVEGTFTGKLLIGVESLSGLPPKQYNCSLEPYVVLNIIKPSWGNRKKQKLHTFKTKDAKHTANPIYRETFIIEDAKPQEIKDWVMDIAAYDHDHYANHTELCTLQVPFREAKNVFVNPEVHMFNYKMKLSNQEFGKVLLGVSFLPTAQRVSINIIRLRDVKLISSIPSPEDFNPYVKIIMLNGKTGRRIKKRKTRFLRSTLNPEFNEILTFDLPPNQLDTLQFLVVLCSTVKVDVSTINNQESDSEESMNSHKRNQDVYLGKVALGKGVRGPTERLHWFSILQNPRKVVTVWHTLK